jgi:hypothetical protein
MQYSAHCFFSDYIEPEDEIDELFNRLQPVELPPDLITHILNSILLFSQPLPNFDRDDLALALRSKT